MTEKLVTLSVSHEPGNTGKLYFAEATAEFDTLEQAQEFAAKFPKSYRVVAGNWFLTPSAILKINLQATKGNPRNDAGIKRLRKFLSTAESLGCPVVLARGVQPEGWGTFETMDALNAALDS